MEARKYYGISKSLSFAMKVHITSILWKFQCLEHHHILSLRKEPKILPTFHDTRNSLNRNRLCPMDLKGNNVVNIRQTKTSVQMFQTLEENIRVQDKVF